MSRNVESASGTTTALPAGNNIFTLSVTDSRGRTDTRTHTIVTYTYSKPSLSGLTVSRCLEDGTAANNGQFVKASFTANVQNTGNANLNSKSWSIQYRIAGTSTWTNWTNGVMSSYTQAISVSPKCGFDISKSYEIRVNMYDYFSAVYRWR